MGSLTKGRAVGVCILLVVVYEIATKPDKSVEPITAAPSTLATVAAPTCSVMQISVVANKQGFTNDCRLTPCPVFRGTATITNACSTPVGVELRITGVDKAGSPVATRTFWPESTRNLPPGDTVVTLDQTLPADQTMDSIQLSVADIHVWN